MIIKETTKLDTENKNRPALLIKCDCCDTEFIRYKRMYNTSTPDGCSPRCIAILRGTSAILKCSHCNKEVFKSKRKLGLSKSGMLFCSRECKDMAQTYMKEIQPPHYGTREPGYREKALKKFGAKCNRCGYSENVLGMDVHHKDYNRDNNNLDNLEVLCCICHAIEHRRKGNGLGDQ